MAYVEDRWMVKPPGGGRRVRGPRYGAGARWRAVWVDEDGTRQRTSCTTKDEAEALLADVAVARRAGTYVSPAASAVPLRQVAERWFAEQVHQRATSLATIRTRLDRTILPTLGDLPCASIDRTVVQAAVTGWTSSLAASTVRVAYVYLAGILGLAVEERRMAATPCTRINLPAVDALPVVPLTTLQVQALVDAAEPRHRPMFVLAAASGLRSAELRGLTWEQVTPTPGGAVLRVDRQLLRTGSASNPSWGPPKTPHSVRNVSIGTNTLAALGEPSTGPIFHTARAAVITAGVAADVWRRAADQIGLPGGDGWHELRHYHASALIAGGASPVAVAHRLGHKDPTETLRTYAHLWPDDDDRMRDATDGLVTLTKRRLRAVS